jgi:hypothetical protein
MMHEVDRDWAQPCGSMAEQVRQARAGSVDGPSQYSIRQFCTNYKRNFGGHSAADMPVFRGGQHAVMASYHPMVSRDWNWLAPKKQLPSAEARKECINVVAIARGQTGFGQAAC